MNGLEVLKINGSEVMMSTNFGVEADSIQDAHVGKPWVPHLGYPITPIFSDLKVRSNQVAEIEISGTFTNVLPVLYSIWNMWNALQSTHATHHCLIIYHQ